MMKFFRKTQPFYILVDIVFLSIAFFGPYFLKYNTLDNLFSNAQFPNLVEYCFVFIFEVVFIITSFKHKRLYHTDRSMTIPRELTLVLVRIFYASIVMSSIIFFAKYLFFSRFIFLVNFSLLVLFLGGWRICKRLILRKLIRDGFRNINILIIGAGENCYTAIEEIKKRTYLGFNIVGFLDDSKEGVVENIRVLGKLSDFEAIAKKYFVDEIIITMPLDCVITELMNQTKKMQLGVRVVPEYFKEPMPILDVDHMGIVPILIYKTRISHPSEVFSKKLFDTVFSLILIILLSPVFLIIAVLIKIDSHGPIFFISKRVGIKGKNFKFFKFRSMVRDADRLKEGLLQQNEAKGEVMFKIKKDPRVTKVGGFLRKYSLDELPQLFNILKGNMSLVGPRPPLPDEVEKYSYKDIERLSIKPGISGLSQVKGRSGLSFSRWVKWDLWYINNWSFGLDIKILLWTIPAVLKGKGAY
jgi:exopolysaccharide biosynthesis polyprenyl glycosylphosphotransferase